jgi:hypothetical protein
MPNAWDENSLLSHVSLAHPIAVIPIAPAEPGQANAWLAREESLSFCPAPHKIGGPMVMCIE